MPFDEAMHAAAKEYLATLLNASNWNVAEAARVAGLNRTHMHRKLRLYGIRRPLPPEVAEARHAGAARITQAMSGLIP